jgi:two-component system nitrogen regulation sensor histidine kinase NtrY
MEDHGGALLLEDRPGGGARVTLVLPRNIAPTAAVTPDMNTADARRG